MSSAVGHNTSSNAVKKFKVMCVEKEKQALLKFKDGLVDEDNQLCLWGNQEEDCCKWRGVKCNKNSGHVYGLDLRPTIVYNPNGISLSYMPFKGEIGSSLLELQYLTYLDLSLFEGSETSIPKFIGSLTNLRYLNFSGCNFIGTIPYQLRNLTRIPISLGNPFSLEALDLSWNNLTGEVPNLSNFSFIKELRLPMNKLNGSLTESTGLLSNVEVMDISSNSMNGVISDIHFLTLSKLRHLDISLNSFTLNLSSYWVPNWVPPFSLIS
ncbi:hypothetical protein GH714_000402 [Hevea brasiliensis]|uniref:Leucine-rich repeat-containing N-terminal plant-type domain-containing protein n=1 Tax=Hevea brasiliensis TaxID=3981 RepID=A0A6A6NAG6_HEVBR|nr:hypothetical protein GH714_000402 [Hevea brasiliensis]